MATQMTKNSAPVPEHGKLITLPGKRVGRLDRITNWEQLAESSCYSASVLAHRCGVSRRHLERHIRAVLAVTLGEWLLELRLRQACKLLGQGWSVKETVRETARWYRCLIRSVILVSSVCCVA